MDAANATFRHGHRWLLSWDSAGSTGVYQRAWPWEADTGHAWLGSVDWLRDQPSPCARDIRGSWDRRGLLLSRVVSRTMQRTCQHISPVSLSAASASCYIEIRNQSIQLTLCHLTSARPSIFIFISSCPLALLLKTIQALYLSTSRHTPPEFTPENYQYTC